MNSANPSHVFRWMKIWSSKGLLFVLLATLAVLTSRPTAHASDSQVSPPTPVKQADAACARCHREIFENYLKTPMANASGVAADRWIPGSFHQKLGNVDYRFFQEKNTAWMSYERPGDAGLAGRYKLEYFLGSGHLGLTYLYSNSGYLFETPAAYYAKLQGYDLKPGVGDSASMPPGLPMNAGCMRCHMSAVRSEDEGTTNHFTGLPFLHGGITCESCHGPSEEHVATRGRARVVDFTSLDPERRDSVCISCHLEGDTHVERAGKRALDYRPGERISDYLTFFEYTSVDATRRGVSEVEQLQQSTCKRRSGDRMSCMSCHDPHFSPPAEERASFYRGKCLHCHADPKFAATHFAATPDCTSCHMPKSGAENIPHVAWTDHRILRKPSSQPSESPSGPLELRSILPGAVQERDMAMAYYDLVTDGHDDERQRAMHLLQQAALSNQDDARLFLALGVMYQWARNTQSAEDAYRRVLRLDPRNMTAAVNMGTLMAQSGQLKATAELWLPVFARNADNVPLGNNLATVECLLGNQSEMRRVLEEVLIFNPGEPRVSTRLRAIKSGQESCPPKGSN